MNGLAWRAFGDGERELLLELEGTTDPLLVEVLDYLRYLKCKHAEDADGLRVARN